MPQKPKGTAAAGLLWDIISPPPLLMLSSLRRCLNAVHAYYNYRPSYVSGITSWDLLPQMTGRLAAHEETSEPGRPAAVATRSRLEMFAAAFFPRGLARACVCVRVIKMGAFGSSAGLEYLPSGIPPSASAAPTAPTTRHIGPSLYH